MILTKNNKQVIKIDSIVSDPSESCGLIIQDKWGDQLVIPTKNNSENPSKNFIINPEAYLRCSKFGNIIGYYHSHSSCSNNNDFSEMDKQVCKGHNINAVLFCVKNQTFSFFYPDEESYTGKSFEWGKQDCFSLIREYYKKELHISLNDYPRDGNWKINNPEMISRLYKKEGFYKVESHSIRKNDCLVFFDMSLEIPSHLGIFLEEDRFLHHPYGRFSRIESYSDHYKHYLAFALRHAKF